MISAQHIARPLVDAQYSEVYLFYDFATQGRLVRSGDFYIRHLWRVVMRVNNALLHIRCAIY